MIGNKRLHNSALVGLVIAFGGLTIPSAFGTTIFSDGMLNVITQPIDDIEVRDNVGGSPSLVVNNGSQVGYQLNLDGTLFLDPVTNLPVSSNSSQSIAAFDTSIVAIAGGQTADSVVANDISRIAIFSGTIGDDIIANDDSSASIAGGTADDVLVRDNAVVVMSAGSVDTVQTSGTATFRFTGGRLDDIENATGASRVFVSGSAKIDDDAFFFGTSRLEATGGQFDDELQFFDNTTAYINGANVDDDLVVANNAVVDIDYITIADAIEASGDSTTNFHGGVIGNLIVGDRAVVNMSGGRVKDVIQVGPGGTVIATGGEFGSQVTASLNARVELLGGTASSIDLSAQSGGSLLLDGLVADAINIGVLAGVAEIAGGSAGSLDVFAELEGEVFISGGVFASGDLEARTGSVITIYGKEFSVLGMPAPFGVIPFVAGNIVGTLADGSPIDVTFRRDFGLGNAAQIVLVNLPEPSAGLMAALAIPAVWSGRRKVTQRGPLSVSQR